MRRLETLLLAAALGSAAPARASLGETVASVEADRKALSAVRGAVTSGPGYEVHEVQAGGTLVREYVSPAGVVFAVAWSGMAHPDLGPLLGTYAAGFRDAEKQAPRRPGNRRQQEIGTDRLVVQRWSHMRDHRGRAWDPSLVPAGVSLDAIR
jgi:hypothetical protein